MCKKRLNFSLFLLISLLFTSHINAQVTTTSLLEKEIYLLLFNNNYRDAMLRTEEIINNANSDKTDLTMAYIGKTIIYKNLENYYETANNLEKALKEASKSKNKDFLTNRINVEKLMIVSPLQ